MPSNILAADVNFPNLEGKSTDEKFDQITSYLYMLLEQLRYSFGNLGAENFNETALGELGNIITEPVYIQISDVEKGLNTSINITAEGIMSTVSDIEGDISMLQQTAEAFNVRITDAEGNASSALQTAESFSQRISDAEGNASQALQTAESFSSRITTAEGDASEALQTANGFSQRITTAEGNASEALQTANSFSTRISDAEGDASEALQTANGFSQRITNAEGQASSAVQKVDSLALSVTNGASSSTIRLTANGTTISSQTIRITGFVTFEDLETDGTTTIHGGNIDTDTLRVDNLYGTYIYLRDTYENIRGNIMVNAATSSYDAVQLESYGAMRLLADDGYVYIQAQGSSGPFLQLGDGRCYLGRGALVVSSESFGWSEPSGTGVAGQVYFQLTS